jgi:hypothetical protein
VLACLLCLSLCASLFVFSASAENSFVSSLTELSYLDSGLYSDSNFSSSIAQDLETSVSTDWYSITMRAPSGVRALSGFATVYNKNGIVSISEGTYVTLSWSVQLVCSGATSGYTATVSSSIGSSQGLITVLPSKVRAGTWAMYYDFTANVPFAEVGSLVDRISARASISGNSSSLIGLGFSDISVTYTDMADKIGNKIDQQTEEQKNMFQRLLDGILNGLKSLFIPSDDFFQNYLSEMNQWLSDHFGALYYPIDLFIDVCGRLLNLEVPEIPSITLPAFQVGETVLLPAQTYSFDMSALPALGEIHSFYLTVVDVIIALWLCGLAAVKLKSIMGG